MMNMIIMNFMLSMMLPVLLIIMNSTLSKKMINEREKPSTFECGFDPQASARLSFSLRFFLVAVIFLIFDVEITMIFPIPMILNMSQMYTIMMITIMFMTMLLMGLYHEWNEGALEWK